MPLKVHNNLEVGKVEHNKEQKKWLLQGIQLCIQSYSKTVQCTVYTRPSSSCVFHRQDWYLFNKKALEADLVQDFFFLYGINYTFCC